MTETCESSLAPGVLKDRIARLMAAIASNPDFNMSRYFHSEGSEGNAELHECGSPSCIAGHAYELAFPETIAINAKEAAAGRMPSPRELAERALAEWLGISDEAAGFMAYPGQAIVERASRQDAVDMLERYAREGVIIWRSGPYECSRPDELVVDS